MSKILAYRGDSFVVAGASIELPGSMFATTCTMRRGDTGPPVVALQERLAEAGYDPGSMWGVFGRQTQEAVAAFQGARGMPVTGVVDPGTLEALFGPDRDDLWGRSQWFVEPEQHPQQGKGGGPVIQVDTTARVLRLTAGEVVLGSFPVAVGKPSTPTPTGRFRILEKVRNPGGPFGTRWMGFTVHRHGIHGTNRPDSIGHAVSKGCVRMFNGDVERVYDRVRVGTPVFVSR